MALATGVVESILHAKNRRLAPCRSLDSGQQWLHDFAMHVGQAVVAALEFEGQPRVVEAQAVQQRRVQVVDVDWVLSDVVREIVGRSV